jgi:sigma-E factor negative regulatory protein RseA
MTESKFETVSSLLDNYRESDKDILVDTIKDQQMSDVWERYHLIGDVLRGDTAETFDLDLSTNIAEAIAEEPTVLAPKKVTVGERFKSTVIQLSKPFGQIAIAASAATLMIVGVQQNNVQNEMVIPTQVVQTTPLLGVASPVSYNFEQPSKISQQQAYIEQQRRLKALLSDHNQQLKLKKLAANDTIEQSIDDVKVENTP